VNQIWLLLVASLGFLCLFAEGFDGERRPCRSHSRSLRHHFGASQRQRAGSGSSKAIEIERQNRSRLSSPRCRERFPRTSTARPRAAAFGLKFLAAISSLSSYRSTLSTAIGFRLHHLAGAFVVQIAGQHPAIDWAHVARRQRQVGQVIRGRFGTKPGLFPSGSAIGPHQHVFRPVRPAPWDEKLD